MTYEITGANGNTVDYKICLTVIDPDEKEIENVPLKKIQI